MNETELVELLDRLGEDVHVSPAPVDGIFQERSRVRRRRLTFTVVGCAAAVALIVTAAVAVSSGEDTTPAQPSATTANTPDHSPPTTEPTPPPAPAGYRLVGVGHASIAVPHAWGLNKVGCGPTSAKTDTVVINVTVYAACAAGLKPGASVVEVGHATGLPQYPGFTQSQHVTIDGHDALRSPIVCEFKGAVDPPCTGAVFVPSASATFQATSYQRDIVASLLDSVSVDEAGVAVPEFNWQTYQRGSDQRFIAAAEALGLRVAVRTGPRQRHREGAIISVRPYAGTVLAPGDTVHLTVAGP